MLTTVVWLEVSFKQAYVFKDCFPVSGTSEKWLDHEFTAFTNGFIHS